MTRQVVRLLTLFTFTLVPTICAQSTFGTILGTVRDPSAATIPSVRVRVVELSTNLTRDGATTADGYYELTNLNPGRYEVQVEHTGFKRFVQRGIVLETAGRVRVDVHLEVGDTTTEVTVTSDIPPVETETARISTIQSQTVFQYLPMAANRVAFNHFVITPGAQLGNGSTYTINGSRGWSNGYTIDGTNTTSPMNGAQESAQRPHFDILQEARIDSVNNSAEFGHAGTFSLTTKSGTNQFHGAAEFQHSNSAFGARNPFASRRPQSRSSYYMTHIAGPLVIPRIYNGRNRTFILLGYDGFTTPAELLLTPNVPALRFREGDFSRLVDARGSLIPVRDPLTGQPFSGNVIPSTRLSPVALNYQRLYYPNPNFGGPDDLSANYRATYSVNNGIENNINGRIDHQVTQDNRFFVRFSRIVSNFKRNATDLPTMGSFRRIRFNNSWTFADTHTFSPTVVNEFRVGGFSKRWPIDASRFGKQAVEEVGLTGYPGALPDDVTGFPTVAITGFTSISNQNASLERLLNLDLHNIVSWVRSKHTMKFGFNAMHTRQNNYPTSPSAVFGNFSFTGFAANYAYADFLLGLPRTSGRADVVAATNSRNYEYAWFAQDDWKITPNLTLNLGIRYEYHLPNRERDNRLANFDPATGAVVIPNEDTRRFITPLYPQNIRIVTAAQAGYPDTRLVNADSNTIAPRFGFAYRIGSGSRTVVRGGFGVFYNNENRKVYGSMVGGPFVGSETYDNVITSGQPLYQWPRAFPGTTARPLGVQNISGANPYLQDSYTQQWNLSVDRELWWQTGLRISYIGHQARQLPYRANLNQPLASTTPFNANRRPYSQFNTITWVERGAVQSYNALQIEANRRFKNGFQFNAHYTWAKNLSDSLDVNALGNLIEYNFDRARERGNETYTPRQRLVASFVYELPVGNGRLLGGSMSRALDAVAGGWSVSGIYFARTGFWFTPSFAGSDPSNTGLTGGRPDRIRDGNLPVSERTLDRWFDATAFAVPAAGSGRFGNAGAGILEGPGANTLGLALFKTLTIYERLQLRINGSFRNLFNHPTMYANPAANISAPGQVARITGFNGTLEEVPFREGYIGIRLQW
ncbi:MAG: carboxypeptidase regulatory-like domain-containing protein [Bryobacteraceae bacterium]